jgi:hypothetical protein
MRSSAPYTPCTLFVGASLERGLIKSELGDKWYSERHSGWQLSPESIAFLRVRLLKKSAVELYKQSCEIDSEFIRM